jgi:transcriptional regulator of heat shock response
MLSMRRQQVLESLIEEYVSSAQPVGSRTLVSRYLKDVSSATIRNELSWLESRGYVISPHVSAGRIPTNTGYRSFVNHLLLRHGPLGASLAGLRGEGLGARQQRAVRTARFDAASMTGILEAASASSGCLAVYWSQALHGTVMHRGLSRLLAQPEFIETQSALPIIQLLEDQGELACVLKDIQCASGLHIRIGTENIDTQLYAFSMLAMRLEDDPARGVLVFFGPTRMNYRKSIISLLYAADEIGDFMTATDKRGRFEY